MPTVRPTYLIMVTDMNNNKYYNAFPDSNGNTFTVKYGRVNATETTIQYNMSMWDKKINEKIKKGYKDVTDLKESLISEVKTPETDEYKPIPVESIRKLINYLQSIARDTIKKNYTVSDSAVTMEMVDKAQELIDYLSDSESTSEFNRILLDLFSVLPRNMNNVSSNLAKNTNDFSSIITKEQNLLDVMRGQVYIPSTTVTNDDNNSVHDMTILDSLGLVIEEATSDDISIIKKCMNESADKFRRAWRVTNIHTQKDFEMFLVEHNIKNRKLLFHGSRSENWMSIMKLGLKIRPSNAVYTGSMFGDGLYFAPKCQKSIGYTSLGGSYWAGGKDKVAYMALFDTAYGTPYNVYSFDSKYYKMNYNNLPNGTNCLHAHAGNGMLRNDEIVYYNASQCTIKYLIEIGN